MCGRFTLRTSAAKLAEVFHFANQLALPLRYNVAPTQPIAIVRSKADEPEREASLVRWGLVPAWAEDLKIGNRMINARAETLAEKPAFRKLLATRRCAVLADGFYEWKATAGGKQPYLIQLASGEPFAFAGLWDRWTRGTGPVESATIVTTSPNELMSSIHDRMPAILTGAALDRWLDPRAGDARILGSLLGPFEAEPLQAFAVSKVVNSPANDSAECVVPL